ncbi:MAG: leucyl/phenylalanyl-tRNA--protein transferase [Burkholderiales bacterium]|jgi:leucyl/phenylalanyl-tRNA--protein transferase
MPLPWIEPHDPLPSPERALRSPDGLVAAGRDLSADRLLQAYRQGIFPWYSAGQPVLWWSPDPRMVLFTREFRCTRSLHKTLRRVRREGQWQISLNTDFDAVMRECAAPRPDQDGTWITPLIRQAYGELHRRGNAHSLEIREEDVLIAGLYGVSIGRMFFGESMFTRRTDASKCALAVLVSLLKHLDFPVIDCQQVTSHLASMGGRPISRTDFLEQVRVLVDQPPPDWSRVTPEFPE